ncbi:unnamed protein product [Adineta steineri]|uniref:P/Homo B domain-containing protein n=1 Tax=Adineta steineri TaxID=433720 RepID=A0A813Z3D3_9BILA|nr:unnamed protein product [Adineta steineri]CAF0791443.1 unnamed protein product [Adineta steineri]CAF0893598.1 unnamed protein product [Adineta steineri]
MFTMNFVFILLIIIISVLNINAYRKEINDGDDDADFIDIGIRLTGDNKDYLVADLIAEENDLFNAGLIHGIGLHHLRIQRRHNRRSKRAINDIIEELQRDRRIADVAVGHFLERQKRDFVHDDALEALYRQYRTWKDSHLSVDIDPDFKNSSLKMSFDDELYQKQWYLENEGQLNTPADHDMNVIPAWLAGYSGKNVTICIIDDGLDHIHEELRDRYQPQFSYDLNDLNDTEHDPSPRTYDSANNHGTRCAGAASGKANNGMCGVGVAYNSNIAGIRLLDGRITTLLEARALTLFAVNTSIKSASWGPTDDGTKMEAPGPLVNAALDYAVTHGRHGKGVLFVWASGNGGVASDDCGADGYVSHQNVISIGSINHLGKSTYFGEFCPSTMAVAYTGGRHARSAHEPFMPVGVVAADVGGKCTTKFFGTSGAAPVAAGGLALVLEANPELTYRDVMHIIAETSRIPNLSETEDWMINGAGFHVSDKFGFGVLDIGQMTALAQNWTNVNPRYECYHEYKGSSLPLGIGATVEVNLDVDKCENVTYLEHVTANVSFIYHRRGDVKITLISPSGTTSEMLSYRDNDSTDKGIKYFPFMSVHKWGESPIGRWTLRVETRTPQNHDAEKSATRNDAGELNYFGLRLFGSYISDDSKNNMQKRKASEAFVPSSNELEWIYKRELSIRQSPNVMQKRDYQNLVDERQRRRETSDESLFSIFRKKFGF